MSLADDLRALGVKPGEFIRKSCRGMTPEERSALFADLPNPRRRHQVTPALYAAFERVQAAGGPAAIAREYELCETG